MKRKAVKQIKRANTGKIHMIEKDEKPVKKAEVKPEPKAEPKQEPKPKAVPEVVQDPDPIPVEATFSGKAEDFPQWVRDDMAYKEAYGNWMARHRKAS